MKKTFWILLVIIAITAGLRLYKLGDVPVSPDWDETALGYNAYSILKTGRDEYGTFLPLTIRSFDDYKPPLYVYLTVPSVALFGLSVWSTRLPSALMGILAVLGTYFLVKQLVKDKGTIALLSSFLLAISPWHIQFSRVAFESNTGVTMNIWAAAAFLAGLKKRIFLPISAVLFGIGMYAYHSERVFLPLLLLLLAVTCRKKLFVKENKTAIVASLVIGFIFAIPLFSILFGSNGLLRLKATSSFTDQTNLLARNIVQLERDQKNRDFLGLILDNRRIVYAKSIISGYMSHFNFNWLFITGDISRHHAPNMGLLYLFELPFLLLGIYYLLFGEFDRKTKFLIFGWLLIAPIPASITTGVPHAVRTLNFLPTFQILSAVGLIFAFVYINRYKKVKYAAYLIFAVIFTFNFSYYLNQYFVQLNYYDSADWQYGYKQAVDEVKRIGYKYDKIVVSDSTPMDKSYMFFLFYLKYPPSDYQKIGQYSSGGFASHHSFDKYEFRQVDWDKERSDKNILYLGPSFEIPKGANILKTIYNLDGSVAIRIAVK
ncbi:MAG: hypothetical protein UR81_C0033G0010 [Candidatus Levybacteria bacterium GW2011_GWB1_35_5]|nr:MAG: hypothetical protein UR81_C0033G0010 [Candidatus Levybacteria bacterium GW2011_GWB1_35_5]